MYSNLDNIWVTLSFWVYLQVGDYIKLTRIYIQNPPIYRETNGQTFTLANMSSRNKWHYVWPILIQLTYDQTLFNRCNSVELQKRNFLYFFRQRRLKLSLSLRRHLVFDFYNFSYFHFLLSTDVRVLGLYNFMTGIVPILYNSPSHLPEKKKFLFYKENLFTKNTFLQLYSNENVSSYVIDDNFRTVYRIKD